MQGNNMDRIFHRKTNQKELILVKLKGLTLPNHLKTILELEIIISLPFGKNPDNFLTNFPFYYLKNSFKEEKKLTKVFFFVLNYLKIKLK